jgi:hypothetical protein
MISQHPFPITKDSFLEWLLTKQLNQDAGETYFCTKDPISRCFKETCSSISFNHLDYLVVYVGKEYESEYIKMPDWMEIFKEEVVEYSRDRKRTYHIKVRTVLNIFEKYLDDMDEKI